MKARDGILQAFLDTAMHAFEANVRDARARKMLSCIFESLKTPLPRTEKAGRRLPVCNHLADVANPSNYDEAPLRRLMETFGKLEPCLEWQRRAGAWTAASPNFAENHANALIIGPGGLEPRQDVWLGASLIAPDVRYPDHNHPPEETYLVLGGGDFYNDDLGWTALGPGDTFYNPPGIRHAMRSGPQPLFAFWALNGRNCG